MGINGKRNESSVAFVKIILLTLSGGDLRLEAQFLLQGFADFG
jgi:hypothetical protein